MGTVHHAINSTKSITGQEAGEPRFANFKVTKSEDIAKLISIFDLYPLNTSKYIDYIQWKEAYELYTNPKNIKTVSAKILIRDIILILQSMSNRKRTNFTLPDNHQLNVTPYWLLGIIEAEGFWSIEQTKYFRLLFGIGLTESETYVLDGIKKFILKLPDADNYKIFNDRTNPVQISTDSEAKNANSKPMAKLHIYLMDFIGKVIIPLFDNLTWLSKKEKDYLDWKIIFSLKNQGKHFLDVGQEVITSISNRMNNNRLSTNKNKVTVDINLETKIKNLLNAPSNLEIHPNGKIFIISKGKYLRGRGNLRIEVFDKDNNLLHYFDSIKMCALYFNTNTRKIYRLLESGNTIMFKGKEVVLKREIITL